jgi:hypothetical protein
MFSTFSSFGSFRSYNRLSSSSKPAVSSTHGNRKPVEWLLDSGASHNATGDLQILFDVKPCFKEFDTSNGSAIAKLVGRAHITFACGTKETLEQVYHLPGLKANLMSEDMLTRHRPDPEQEYATTRYRGSLILMQGTQQRSIPTRSIRNSTTFVRTMCAVNQHPVPYAATSKETAELWHARLGHPSYDTMSKMVKNQAVSGINIKPEDCTKAGTHTCTTCATAKATRQPFKQSEMTYTEPLQLVSSDVCDPLPTTSLGGSRYFITLVDHATDFSIVSTLKTKDQVPDAIKRSH